MTLLSQGSMSVCVYTHEFDRLHFICEFYLYVEENDSTFKYVDIVLTDASLIDLPSPPTEKQKTTPTKTSKLPWSMVRLILLLY